MVEHQSSEQKVLDSSPSSGGSPFRRGPAVEPFGGLIPIFWLDMIVRYNTARVHSSPMAVKKSIGFQFSWHPVVTKSNA